MALLIVEKFLVRLIFLHRVYVSQIRLGCVTVTYDFQNTAILYLALGLPPS